MALTAGFKKLLALVAVSAVVGGGLYYYKSLPKAPPAPAETATAEIAPAPADTIAPVQPPHQAENVQPEPDVAPAQAAPKSSAANNRGLDAVLNAGKK